MYVSASNATVDCHKGSKCMENMIGLKIKKKGWSDIELKPTYLTWFTLLIQWTIPFKEIVCVGTEVILKV